MRLPDVPRPIWIASLFYCCAFTLIGSTAMIVYGFTRLFS